MLALSVPDDVVYVRMPVRALFAMSAAPEGTGVTPPLHGRHADHVSIRAHHCAHQL